MAEKRVKRDIGRRLVQLRSAMRARGHEMVEARVWIAPHGRITIESADILRQVAHPPNQQPHGEQWEDSEELPVKHVVPRPLKGASRPNYLG